MAALANLLERESELAELELAQERALEGEGRFVVIEGAAGIGKTSLLRAVRDQASAGLPLLAAATVRPLQGEAAPALADLLADPVTLVIRPSPLTREAAAVVIGERLSVDSY